jgi:hypothetical protein
MGPISPRYRSPERRRLSSSASYSGIALGLTLFGASSVLAETWPPSVENYYNAQCNVVHKERWQRASPEAIANLCTCKLKELASYGPWAQYQEAFKTITPEGVEQFVALPHAAQEEILAMDNSGTVKLVLLRMIRAEEICAGSNLR